jgi:hypothetical protein
MMRRPVFGILSAVAPVLGIIVYFVGVNALRFVGGPLRHDHGAAVFHELVFDILPTVAPICGILFAIIAGVRKEPYPALRWIGFLLNLAIMLFLFVILGFAPISH